MVIAPRSLKASFQLREHLAQSDGASPHGFLYLIIGRDVFWCKKRRGKGGRGL